MSYAFKLVAAVAFGVLAVLAGVSVVAAGVVLLAAVGVFLVFAGAALVAVEAMESEALTKAIARARSKGMVPRKPESPAPTPVQAP